MKKVFLVLLIAISAVLGFVSAPSIFDSPVKAQAGTTAVLAATSEAYDFDTITVSTAVVGLTAAKLNPTGARSAIGVHITVRTNTIRYRYDGAAVPSATVGHQILANGERYVFGINNLNKLRMIRESADATVDVTYLR